MPGEPHGRSFARRLAAGEEQAVARRAELDASFQGRPLIPT